MAYERNQAGHIPGGGIASNKCVYKDAPKTEPHSRAVRPAEADHLGQALAYEPEPLFSGEGFNGPHAGEAMPWSQGPGGGRVLYGQSGTNQTYGPVAKPEPDLRRDEPAAKPGKDILSMFGPEMKGR
jgi:hypothetical protein